MNLQLLWVPIQFDFFLFYESVLGLRLDLIQVSETSALSTTGLYHCPFLHFLLRQALIKLPRLALNFVLSYLSLLSSWASDLPHQQRMLLHPYASKRDNRPD